MRALVVLLGFLVLVPSATAEFGRYDASGYPVAVDGTSTFPGGIVPGAALPPLNAVGPLTVYPYYPVLTAEMQRIASEHPDLVKLHSIGQSTLGLELWMLEIADFARIEAGEGIPLEEREVVWVDGGHHSNEYSGVWFAAHLASWLTDGYGSNETARWVVENRHLWVMPMVNPDGSHAMGRLNANTVNINRNYPVDWGALAEDPLMNNPGPEPMSEVETQHNVEWFNLTRPDLYVSVHCCGNLWLYPYGVEGLDPLDNATFARVCAEAFASVVEDCGPIWSTIYPASGSSVDTVYEYTGAVAFGYEMSGRNALALWGQPVTADTVEAEERESWDGLLHGLLNVHRYGAFPNVTAARVVDGALVVTIQNEGYGALANATISLPAGLRGVDGAPEAPAAMVEATRAIPPLAPGESATVTIDEPLVAGEWRLELSYQQRVQAAPVAARGVPLALAHTADGLQVVALGGVEPLDAASVANDVPALPAALVLAALALVALRRR